MSGVPFNPNILPKEQMYQSIEFGFCMEAYHLENILGLPKASSFIIQQTLASRKHCLQYRDQEGPCRYCEVQNSNEIH